MGKQTRKAALQLKEHGQNIFFYKNIRTNQVLYSLDRTLNNTLALRQLPDAGANHTPPKLRKDLWQPFLTVSFPPGRAAQGLDAFHKLREYRRLHETNWEPSPLLSRPYNEDEVAEWQKKLEQKTGSKKQTVWDLIKRAKKKMRVREVLDQKANSVADLAAVLIEQEDLGARTLTLQSRETNDARMKEVGEMLQLARVAEKDGIAKLDARIAELQAAMQRAGTLGENKERRDAKLEIHKLGFLRQKMEFAAKAVEAARQKAEPKVGQKVEPNGGINWPVELPSFPSQPPSNRIPKRGRLRQQLLRANVPIFSSEGIKVRWADVLDAEFAEQWPERVEHGPLGFTRHTAPRVEEEPVADVEMWSLAKGGSRKYKETEAVTPQEKKRREERVGIVKGEILRRVRSLEAGDDGFEWALDGRSGGDELESAEGRLVEEQAPEEMVRV